MLSRHAPENETIPAHEEGLLLWTFSLFFCNDPVRKAAEFVFGLANLPGADIFSVLVVYAPLLFALIERARRGEASVHLGFPFLFCTIVGILAVTLTVHPEYSSKVFQEGWQYNFVDSVLYPLTGLYAFAVVLATRKPETIFKGLQLAALLCFAYGIVRFAVAFERGYWEAYIQTGALVHRSYSLGFGYDMLFCAIVFMLLSFKGVRKSLNITLAILTVGMILVAGNRAPLGIIAVAFLAFGFRYGRIEGRFKTSYVLAFLVAFLMIIFFVFAYRDILAFLSEWLNRLGIGSRSIDALIQGSFSDDNGRESIYAFATKLIEEGPFFGYGLYGDRYYLGQLFYWGYPHNIVYELQITFGAIPGAMVFCLLIIYVVHGYVVAESPEYKDLILLFTLLSLKLAVSVSYLYTDSFWALLAVVYLVSLKNRKTRSSEGKIHGC
ncbi:hypothetical protein C1878_03815 [Gordonibacter sp. 28C]|uniref:O-antigen ligase family protein n=1 Tax=Gordonibacter sp. 28C TaxID=2078569 RepID=UPI000E127767|nr:O-antigen ligase family protein [Gordonibacter sp. 28C]RDB63923.1 hypothetical protein C1878_03815 [Gordonibacter sp. 28C]